MNKKVKLLLTLGVAATLSLGAVAFAACGEEPTGEHEHMWGNYDVVTEATCTEAGTKVAKCMVEGCNATDEKEIKKKNHSWGMAENTATCEEDGVMRQFCKREGCNAYQDTGETTKRLGHDFELKEVIKDQEPSCTKEGKGVFECTRCTTSKEETLPKLEHEFGSDATRTEATCEADGTIHGKCTSCGQTIDQPIPALGHNWIKNGTSKQPTCTEDGEESYFCLRSGCGQTKVEELPALGHTYDDSTITYATFEAPGEEVGHCSVCDKTVTTVLPQLEEGMEIEYQFKIVRNNGDLIGSPSMRIIVTDKNGTEVASGVDTVVGDTQYYGLVTAKLPVHQGEVYTMTVTSLYSGYTANQKSVAVSPEHPVGEYKITAHLIEATDRSPSSFPEGSIMQDFTMTDTKGYTRTLKEALAENKLVMLNFFGIACDWCNVEFPGLIKAYQNYKDRGVEVICIAPEGQYKNTLESVTAVAEEYPFPVIYVDSNNSLSNLYSKFGLGGFPASVFIDHEGVVAYIHKGAMMLEYNDKAGKTCQAAFEMMFDNFVNWEWPDMTSAESLNAQNGLEVAMLRGDYLPCDEQ